MVRDETPLDDENGGDSETIVRKPLSSSQKKVIQNIITIERFSAACDESSSVQRVQQNGILQKLGFQQPCRGLFASTKHLEWIFLRLSLQMVPKSFSATLVCWGTLYQLCILVLDKTAATVAKCIAERWIQFSGPPVLIIADQEEEFVGTQIKEFTTASSILFHIIDVRAPWQNGRTERHGDIYKRIFKRACWMHSPSGPSDDVYAPDPVYDLAATDASFEESRQIREAAMKAHAEVAIHDPIIEDPIRARRLMTSSWYGKRTRHRNAVCGSTCAGRCGSAASFSANWLAKESRHLMLTVHQRRLE